ncbi:diaminopimelate decarboxylase [Frankia torreyi]|uniref:Diaminopimelate decarboxylase n=1 Tax=Frankia torreyi TaxID=1856 RepID=A0A0D8BHR7_9ACTN|nr:MULTISPECIES: diaminopimelate decarboxylase [Frankia]KJE22977.1 diaminopimelate decarboxylase [Frankia torreyi]KQC35737.1 diaminopimelate decarboxylase [Frankia sp. ACN1ag]
MSETDNPAAAAPEVGAAAVAAPVVALEENLWPATARLDPDGVLRIGGVRVDELAAEFGTPAFVLDEADFRARCAAWRRAFSDCDVYYAGKAFLCRAVARWVAEEGLNLDVCTGGELAVARSVGFPAARLLFHGNNKSVAELRAAVAYGVGRIVVDSFAEIDRLAAVAAEAGVRQRVLVRVTPGVEAHTHHYVSTGQEDQKFGFSLADGAAAEAVERVLAAGSLHLVGLHAHIGSQIFDTAGFGLAAHRMVGLLARIRDTHDLELPELDLGGGLGIAYTSEDAPLEVADVAERLTAVVGKECAAAGLAVPRLGVEPGRAVVGPTTVTLYEVGTVKELPGLRTFVSVDGGMSDNIRTALYDARYTARLVSRAGSAAAHVVTLVGRHCESGDVVAHDVPLPDDVRPGDLVAVPASGAYHRSMASNYNHVTRPPVVAVRDGVARLIVRRETEEDLLRLDIDPADQAGPAGQAGQAGPAGQAGQTAAAVTP